MCPEPVDRQLLGFDKLSPHMLRRGFDKLSRLYVP
jgi:hypothetical protein